MIGASITSSSGLTWWHIIRLGLIQTSLGGIVVLTTSTLNRIMVVELALAATLPGFLVTIHHIVQLARPRIGYGSDVGGRRTPWIIGGMFVLGLGGVLAALGTTLIPSQYWLGLAVSALGFFAIGVGTGATGTSLLALLAKQVAPERKPAAAALVWFMMIIGFAVTAGVAGHFLDPYSPERLMIVTTTVSVLAILVTLLVVRGIEPDSPIEASLESTVTAPVKGAFSAALAEIWQEPQARVFTIFVFVSMLGRAHEQHLVAGSQCLFTGYRKRRFRCGGNRRHDGAGQCRPTETRGYPHGPVGCSAGHRFCTGRIHGYGRRRCHALLVQ